MCCNSDGITRSSPQGTAVPTAHFAVCHDHFSSVVLSLSFLPETDSPTTHSQALDLQSSILIFSFRGTLGRIQSLVNYVVVPRTFWYSPSPLPPVLLLRTSLRSLLLPLLLILFFFLFSFPVIALVTITVAHHYHYQSAPRAWGFKVFVLSSSHHTRFKSLYL